MAVPTLITAALLMPARMGRVHSGSSIRSSIAAGDRPSASADSRMGAGMSDSPLWVFRTMGSRL